jgi:6-phosphofructokinase 1
MGGTSAAMILHQMISQEFGWRGEFQVTESLQMSGADRAVDLDFKEAYACGREAVKLALKGHGGMMVTIEREPGANNTYKAAFGTAPLREVANHERPMPDKFIARNGMDVTPAFLEYAQPLIGSLPEYSSLPHPKRKRS